MSGSRDDGVSRPAGRPTRRPIRGLPAPYAGLAGALDRRVGVVLVATGPAAAPGSWEALADLALGSFCLAAAEGCH